MTEFFQAISNFGFPVVVAGYLLFRFESKIERLGDTMGNLEKAIQDLITEVHILSGRK